ncbi:MAG: DUF4340 domain-containing protein [bacterium]|nr:DUF4340 domain-containing protein [bacterium]
MSAKSFKKEYIILVAVIAALFIYLGLRKGDKIHYDLPELETIEGKNLTKVEIARTPEAKDGKEAEAETLVLLKKDDKWLLQPNGFPVDADKMKEISGTVEELELSALASKSKNYSRYGLADKKVIKVKAYEKEKVVREFEIGKVTASNNHTFVKLKDDTNVYHAKKSFRKHFEQKTGDLRDKAVLKLDTNEISEIKLDKEAESYTFVKSATSLPKVEVAKDAKDGKDATPPAPQQAPETFWAAKDGTKAKKATIDSLLNEVKELKCDDFVLGKQKKDFEKPVYTILLKGKKDYTLTFYSKRKSDDGETDKYPVVSSENDYPFWLSTYKAEGMMKKQADLLDVKVKEEKKENKPAAKKVNKMKLPKAVKKSVVKKEAPKKEESKKEEPKKDK